MKKLLSIMLVLTVFFAFGLAALAEESADDETPPGRLDEDVPDDRNEAGAEPGAEPGAPDDQDEESPPEGDEELPPEGDEAWGSKNRNTDAGDTGPQPTPVPTPEHIHNYVPGYVCKDCGAVAPKGYTPDSGEASAFSGGNMTIVCTIAGVAVGLAGGCFLFGKKKKTAES